LCALLCLESLVRVDRSPRRLAQALKEAANREAEEQDAAKSVAGRSSSYQV